MPRPCPVNLRSLRPVSSSRRAGLHVTLVDATWRPLPYENETYDTCKMPRVAYSNSNDSRNTIWHVLASMSHRTRGDSDRMGTCHLTRATQSARDMRGHVCTRDQCVPVGNTGAHDSRDLYACPGVAFCGSFDAARPSTALTWPPVSTEETTGARDL